MGADRVSETKTCIATACPKDSKQQAVLEQHHLLYMTMPGKKCQALPNTNALNFVLPETMMTPVTSL